MSIYFFRAKKWFEFSNFYISDVFIDDRNFTSVEAYFQASKFRGTGPEGNEYADLIESSTPKEAFYLGRQKVSKDKVLNDVVRRHKHVEIRNDWEFVKDYFMRRAIFSKFYFNSELKDFLLSTDDLNIYENSPYDYYWGIGKKKDGKNKLGEILMEVRFIIRLLDGLDVELEEPSFKKSNWVLPTGNLLSSAYPGSKSDEGEIINDMIENDSINTIVSLMTEKEMVGKKMLDVGKGKKIPIPLIDYRPYLPEDVSLIHIPIPDQDIVDDQIEIDAAYLLFVELQNGKNVMVHCYGGKGRTGVLLSLLVSMIYSIDGYLAMEIVQKMFDMRVNKGSKRFLKTPQTEEQIEQVLRITDDDRFKTMPICN